MEMPTWVLQLLGHAVTLVGVIGFYYWKARDANRDRFDRIDEKFARIDERFDKIDEKFDKVNARIDATSQELHAKIDATSQELSTRINEVASKVDMVWGHLGLTGKADRQT